MHHSGEHHPEKWILKRSGEERLIALREKQLDRQLMFQQQQKSEKQVEYYVQYAKKTSWT